MRFSCQTVVLKVSIHCEGCKKKVVRILSKVQGVQHAEDSNFSSFFLFREFSSRSINLSCFFFLSGIDSIEIDIRQNKVTVKSPVDAQALIQKLKKHGKHAELLQEVVNPSVPAHVSSPPETEETKEKPQKPTKIVVESSGSSPSTAAKKSPEAEKVEAVDKSVSEAKEAKEKVEMKKDEKNSETSKPAAIDKSEKAPESREVEAPKKVDDNKAKSAVEFRGDHIPQQVFPPQPAYIMSYNMTQPGMSQSHFVTPVAAASSQGHVYDDQYQYYPRHYDGLVEPHPDPTAYLHQPAVDPYNIMFSDENPNASCSLM